MDPINILMIISIMEGRFLIQLITNESRQYPGYYIQNLFPECIVVFDLPVILLFIIEEGLLGL
jgi:hypothetical protein